MRRLYVGLLALLVIVVVYNRPANSMEMSAESASAAVEESMVERPVVDTPTAKESVVVVLPEASYTWTETTAVDGRSVVAGSNNAFTLEFSGDQVIVSTDCNHGVSSYEANEDGVFIFGIPALTRRNCTDSQEKEYLQMLSDVRAYEISEAGVLTFTLKGDGGTMKFE